jgi:transcriptional regulator with XRE-family HTH domain
MGLPRVQLVNHMTERELAERHQSAKSPQERNFWRTILLYAAGKTMEQVGAELSMSKAWVARAIERYNAKGALSYEPWTIQEQKAHIAKLRAMRIVTVEWIETDLGIDYKTFIRYESGEEKAKPRILNLLRELATGKSIAKPTKSKPEGSRQERFIKAIRKLLGDELLKTGFADKDPRKAAFIKILEDETGISYRTLYRYLPPYGTDLRVKENLTRAVEDAARTLGRLKLRAS